MPKNKSHPVDVVRMAYPGQQQQEEEEEEDFWVLDVAVKEKILRVSRTLKFLSAYDVSEKSNR